MLQTPERTVALDFETYYDSEYTLKKLSTEAYINDARFEVIGVSVKINHEVTKFYRYDQVEQVLRSLALDTPGTYVISHNARFDMGILAFRYQIYPWRMIDTLAMATVSGLALAAGGGSLSAIVPYVKRTLGWYMPDKGDEVVNMLGRHARDMTAAEWVSYGNYCVDDTQIAWTLWNNMRDQVPADEMYLIHVTTEMFTKPVFALDVPVLKEYAIKLVNDREAILTGLAAAWQIQGQKKGSKWLTPSDVLRSMLRSGPKFAQLLLSLGVEPPMKRAAKSQSNPTATNPDGSNKMTYAFAKTDLAFQEIMDEHPDDRVRAICEARVETYGSLADSRTRRFIEVGERGGLLPIPLLYGGAHTLRYGGCVVAETMLTCLTTDGYVVEKRIVDVLLSDLVWDGQEFIEHEGVTFSGYQEVFEWDGITATAAHPVFTGEGADATVGLLEAARTGTPIVEAAAPQDWEYHFGRLRTVQR